MKIFTCLSFVILALMLIISCKSKEDIVNQDIVNDYLPLKVGAKYKYNYSDNYGYVNEGSTKYGECTWEFISSSSVQQTFNGIYIYKHSSTYPYDIKSDTTQIRNEISNLSFEVSGNAVTFNHFLPYWGKVSLTFVRLFRSDGSDICLNPNLRSVVCLKKDVGITRLENCITGNHSGSVSYSLIEGPIY